MFGIPNIPADPRWVYDDPSGLPEEATLTLHLPEPLLESVRAEAARSGATPTGWLLDLVERSVRPIRPKAA